MAIRSAPPPPFEVGRVMCSQELDSRRSDPPPSSSSSDADCSPIMESPVGSSPAAPDETPRVKFLCSFGGSILPRPLDGRLRYVGGETRIVRVPRDVSYDGLLARMRELFGGAAFIKYQQPDEDLDALVSVVNDDDVMHMMEEYDKFGAAGDGFTRLRIFLFSQQQQQQELDPASHFDADEQETERRYVDALNSLIDIKIPSSPDVPEQFLGPLGESPFSPAYFSSGCHPFHNLTEFPSSPTSVRLHPQPAVGEVNDSISDEYVRQSPGFAPTQYDLHQSAPLMENVLRLPPGAVFQEKAGFPNNLGISQNIFEGSNICEHYRMTYNRSQAAVSDPRWKQGQPHMEQSNSGNEYKAQFSNSYKECYRNWEACMLNQDMKLDPGVYVREQSEHHRPFYNDAHGHDRGWVLHQHQVGHRLEDPRVHPSGRNRVGEHYAVDGNAMNASFAHGNFYEGHSVPSNCINREDARYLWPGNEHGNEVFHAQQAVGGFTQAFIPSFEDTAIRCGNHPSAYGIDNLYQLQQNLPPIQSIRKRAQVPMCPGASYELSGSMMPNGGMNSGFIRSPQDLSPRLSHIGAENQIQNSWSAQNGSASLKILGFDGPAPMEYIYDRCPRPNPSIIGQDGRLFIVTNPVQCQPGMLHVEVPSEAVPPAPTLVDDRLVASAAFGCHFYSKMGNIDVELTMRVSDEKSTVVEAFETNHEEVAKESDMQVSPSPNVKQNVDFDLNNLKLTEASPNVKQNVDFDLNNLKLTEEECHHMNLVLSDANAANEHGGISVVFASVEEASLEGAEVAKGRFKANADENVSNKQNLDFHSNKLMPTEEECHTRKLLCSDATAANEHEGVSVEISFLPELIASVKKAALEGADVIKARVEANADKNVSLFPDMKESSADELDPLHASVELEADSDGDAEHQEVSKIEPTTAEAEALAKGLQTIRNDDLEEIKELGSGTYGAVYHGKWKGSDVAIKRIKASCFAGRPSERERLIADFWKEALILSSLHHPNVVSFYGIVRDGPDGSLATVTEFMVNGSLKQFLQKKDRTIDRRKRLIIAMDAAFGMEYLHGKNIVHFDLKCENLLVNMRDPHRPVCKIGDLGLSKVKQHTLVSGGVRGTLPWMAPELLSGKSNMVTEKIDVYSFGIVMWELLTGEEPYTDMHCASIIGGIVHNTLRPQIPVWCDPEWKALMESCWSSDPGERPSFSEISHKLRKMAAAINLK